MMKRFTTYILIMLLCSAGLMAADNVAETDGNVTEVNVPITKALGDSAYINHEYAEAINIYEELLKGGTSADIYYNLGNAYFRTDNIAKAIVNYERALLLKPNNADFKANLAIARAKIVDKFEPAAELFFVSWGKWLVNQLNSNQWAIFSMILFVGFLVSLGFLILSKVGHIKRIGLIVAAATIILVPVTSFCAYYQKASYLNRDAAIVIEPSVTVRSTPSESGTSLFVVHEGKRVEIKDNSMSSWKEIKLENGEVGWVPVETIEVI